MLEMFLVECFEYLKNYFLEQKVNETTAFESKTFIIQVIFQ